MLGVKILIKFNIQNAKYNPDETVWATNETNSVTNYQIGFICYGAKV
jgi:hypothetical protein